MEFNKTVKIESDFPFVSESSVKIFSVSDITTVTFDINGVAKYQGSNYNLGILKTIAHYGDNEIEIIPSQLNPTTLGFEPVSSFDHTYHVDTEDSNLLGKLEFKYKNGETHTVFLSVFTSQSNNIDLELYTANNQSFFSNGEVRELINFTNHENTLYSMAYTPTPLYKFDDKTGSIEFFTLTGAGNFLATEDGTPILLKGFSYNDLFINVT
tara:strand:+ start:43396 stop:44028 length:633 start_codon:yes stop_codon:yes gene_type:complete